MKVKSFRIKLWLYFVLFAAMIFSVLWLLQTVFLQGFYNQMLIGSTRSAARTILDSSTDEDITEVIDKISRRNSLLVYITDQEGEVLYISDAFKNVHSHTEQPGGMKKQKHSSYRSLPEGYDTFLQSLCESENGVVEYQNNSLYVYGAYINYPGVSGESVLYVSVTLDAVGAAVNIIRIQLAIVTVFSLVTGFVLAWFIARKFAAPVSQLTEKARNLGENDHTDFKKGFCSELDELNQTLDETSEKLKISKSFQNELLANVSHDLRTPLTMIKGYAEEVGDYSWSDEKQRREDIAVIIRETDRLTALVNEILEYSELQTMNRRADFERLDFGKLVHQAANQFNTLYQREGGRMELQIAENVLVSGNHNQLERAVYNLLDNAMRHTGDGKRVTVTLGSENGKAVLRVTDYGSGIPADQLEAIWERYYTNRQRGGKGVSGLGLAIVRQITMLHGGTCRAESTEGKGSTFILTLPEG